MGGRLSQLLYRSTCASALAFVEEALPFSDAVPTATIAWALTDGLQLVQVGAPAALPRRSHAALTRGTHAVLNAALTQYFTRRQGSSRCLPWTAHSCSEYRPVRVRARRNCAERTLRCFG